MARPSSCVHVDANNRIASNFRVIWSVYPYTANPASANRPAWSALENRMLRCTVGDEMRDWQDALKDFFANWNGEL